jgi:hypothetical protein
MRPYKEGEDLADYMIEKFVELYRDGHREALFDIAGWALTKVDAVPKDIRDDFSKSWGRYKDHEVRTLDDAFGIHREKGARLKDRRNWSLYSAAVYIEVTKRHKAGAKIDDGLFEQVAEDLGIDGIGKTTANGMYYAVAASLKNPSSE